MEENKIGPFSTSHFCLICNVSLEPEPDEPEPILVDLEASDDDEQKVAVKVHQSKNEHELSAQDDNVKSVQSYPETVVTVTESLESQVKQEPEAQVPVDCEDAGGEKYEIPMESEEIKPGVNESEYKINETLILSQDKKTMIKSEGKAAVVARSPNRAAVIPYSDEDRETLKKYHEFLKTVLHIDIKNGPENKALSGSSGGSISSFGLMQETYNEFPFCVKCKDKIKTMYDFHAQMTRYTRKFEKSRDAIATTMVTTYFEQKILTRKPGLDKSKSATLKTSNSKIKELLEKWKNVYTGEAEKQNKIKSLRKEIEERVKKNVNQVSPRPRVDFPEGTGLSLQELLKMQRMMTACYFTPKMSIVRKKDKLFFRIGIPKGNAEAVTYTCKVCHMNFTRERTLNIHMRTHKFKKYKKKRYQCKACGKVCKNLESLIAHKREHMAQLKKTKKLVEKFECDLCGRTFLSKSAISIHHMKNHELSEPHQCTVCNETFKTAYHFRKHSQRHGIMNGSVLDLYSCKGCSKAFLKVENFNNHLKVHSNSGVLECSYCGLTFETTEALEEHSVVHVDGNPYNCEGCSSSFPSEAFMINHLKTHRPKLFQCLYCSKSYRTSDGLQNHEGTHNQARDKLLACEVCDEGFVDRKAFLLHSAEHREKSPYKCFTCDDKIEFKDLKCFRKHRLEAHPDEIPEELKFHCEICWNSFSSPEILEEHNNKVHHKYTCGVCNRVFKLADHLRRHSFIHTGEKPFKCEHCPKSFNQESNLKEHMYRHTGIRPHQCPHCPGVGYLRRLQLKEHMEKEHQILDVPTLPLGRASQNARRAGTHPVQDPVLMMEPAPMYSEAATNFNVASSESDYPIQAQPVIVNSITLDGTSGRLAPIIMKNLQNRSNQSMIVRRGIQPTESRDVSTANVKPEPQVEFEVTEAVDQQYVIYI